MMPLSEGMDLDPNVYSSVLSNKLAQMATREAQMEAAIQQLIMEKQALTARIDELEGDAAEDVAAEE